MSFDSLLSQILEELKEINMRQKLQEITPKIDYERDISEIKMLLENILEELNNVKDKIDFMDK
jgi:hypothetical protein